MNKFIKHIEEKGRKYGLRLNKGKCELICLGDHAANMHFANGEAVERKHEAKYFGCILTETNDINKEVNQKISQCCNTMQKLQLFWRHSDCPVSFKITAFNAIIRTKRLYSLESAELNGSAIRRIDVFQLKSLRKKYAWTQPTLKDQTPTTKYLNKSNEALSFKRRNSKPIKAFSEVYLEQKMKWLHQIAKMPNQEPLKSTTFRIEDFKSWITINRRQGRPKITWPQNALKQYWDRIKAKLGWRQVTQDWKHTPEQVSAIKDEMELSS